MWEHKEEKTGEKDWNKAQCEHDMVMSGVYVLTYGSIQQH